MFPDHIASYFLKSDGSPRVDYAGRFNPLVAAMITLLCSTLSWSEDNFITKIIENKEFVKILNGYHNEINDKSEWKSEPNQFLSLVERHLCLKKETPENETKEQYANSVRILFTTLGSLLISIDGINKEKSRCDILNNIHTFWVLCTKVCFAPFSDKLKEREDMGQFKDFDQLSTKEQNKDALFYDTLIKK